MRRGTLEGWPILNEKGVTLIELLVVLVITGIVVGGVYKVFIAQTKAYTVQDQVAEVQQDVRGAMEIMARDIRMAGYQTNSFQNNPNYFSGSNLISTQQIVTPLTSGSIQLYYEYNPSNPQVYGVTYALVQQANGTLSLYRTLTVYNASTGQSGTPNPSDLLDNVASLSFMYAVASNGDGIVNGINTQTGIISDNPNDPNYAFQNYATVNGTVGAIICAVRIQLTANPASTDPDVNKIVTPRTLTTVVTPRNIFFKRYQAYQ